MDANDIAKNHGIDELRRISDAAGSQQVEPCKSGGKVALLTLDQARNRRSSQTGYLIEGLVRPGTIVAVGSRPGHGKTALLVELAKSLTAGTPFLGHSTTRASVAYFAPEDQADVLNRLEAAGAHSVRVPEFKEGFDLTKPATVEALMRELIARLHKDGTGRPVVFIIDTLRAALGDSSVLDDRLTSPALNKLRRVAEEENATIVIANHTNRENPRATKGETLEAVAALELILLPDGDGWFKVSTGKNRSGPGGKVIAKVSFTSIPIDGVDAAIIDQVDGDTHGSSKTSSRGINQRLFSKALEEAISAEGEPFHPTAFNGEKFSATRESAVFRRFEALKPASNKDTIKKGFDRAMESAAKKGECEKQVRDGEAWLMRKTSG